MSQTLYRKYRPLLFADVVGQKHIVETLQNALRLDRVAQAYLFTGPRGTGKTTLARILARAVNCTNLSSAGEPCQTCEHCKLMDEGRSMDILEIDAASYTSVDNVRELRENVKFKPSIGKKKVYIIDEAHMLSTAAWNAFLKTLEEPPAHVLFIFATTALHKVPATVVSRCQRFDLGRFSVPEIVTKLERVVKSENLALDKEVLELVAVAAEGGLRDAESLLAQLASMSETAESSATGKLTASAAAEILGIPERATLFQLTDHLAARAISPALEYVQTLSESGRDLPVFAKAYLSHLRDLMLVVAAPHNADRTLAAYTTEEASRMQNHAKSFNLLELTGMIELFAKAEVEAKISTIPALPIEIAIVKSLAPSLPDTSQRGAESAPKENVTSPAKIPGEATTTEKKRVDGTSKPALEKAPAVIAAQSVPAEAHLPKTAAENAETIAEAPVGAVSYHDVVSRFQEIVRVAIAQKASLGLALTNAKPISIDGDRITLAVSSSFHKERLESPAAKLTLEAAFATILGTKVRLTIVVTGKDDKTEPEKEAPNDPLISDALSAFGGEVVG